MRRSGIEPESKRWQRLVITATLSAHSDMYTHIGHCLNTLIGINSFSNYVIFDLKNHAISPDESMITQFSILNLKIYPRIGRLRAFGIVSSVTILSGFFIREISKIASQRFITSILNNDKIYKIFGNITQTLRFSLIKCMSMVY